ncbi:lipase member K-like [Aphidius gifuensis]|uniref:lipase member K-like n=1 Tax=Aphidius gifuensis TaxID=684658 RepID=UPI001CDB9069|nr:lipase member K-like [Aphidius gifuensis]
MKSPMVMFYGGNDPISTAKDSAEIIKRMELIQQSGYQAEQHNVTTNDGYILNIFRIPRSPSKFTNETVEKPFRKIIFMLSGIATSSNMWVFTGSNISLAMQLADEGYEIWLGNYRGSTYGRNHIKLSPNDKKFWDFSFHEHGYYDVPASIDYILNITNQSSLIYIGYSMGTTSVFITLSEHPEYNSKIQLVINLSPVAGFFNKPDMDLSSLPLYTMFFLQMVEKFLKYCPAGVTGKTFIHYAQFAVQKHGFRKFDYENSDENIKRYGKSKPPKYNLKNVKSPMLIFHGENDPVSTAKDTEEIIKRVSSKVIAISVPFDYFTHLDFIMAKNLKNLVNNQLIKQLDQFTKENIF